MKKLLILLFALWATAAPAQNLGQSQSLPFGSRIGYSVTGPTTDSVTARYQYIAPKVYAFWWRYNITVLGTPSGAVFLTLPAGMTSNALTSCSAINVATGVSQGAVLTGTTVEFWPNPWTSGQEYDVTCVGDMQ